MAFKQFNNSTKFLLLYVDFLFRLGDGVNIRALLEKILNQVTLDKVQLFILSFIVFNTPGTRSLECLP
jgi:hypothetical protein